LPAGERRRDALQLTRRRAPSSGRPDAGRTDGSGPCPGRQPPVAGRDRRIGGI